MAEIVVAWVVISIWAGMMGIVIEVLFGKEE